MAPDRGFPIQQMTPSTDRVEWGRGGGKGGGAVDAKDDTCGEAQATFVLKGDIHC